MQEKTRLIATLVIWIGFTIMTSTLLTSVTGPIATANGAAVFGIVLVLAMVALLSTLVVWVGGHSYQEVERESRIAKAKRTNRNRVERLIESLDDDEIYDLEALLLSRDQDGELPRRRTKD
jgi:membrane protein implicated in regulation of membrane protease activity